MKYNACIQFISSRDKCLKGALETLFKYYNHKYNYPVYIYYFDDIYDSLQYRKDIHSIISENIHFVQVPYGVPKHIPEKELFYNRKELFYVRKSFPKSRTGYLHMCHFNCNVFTTMNTLLHKYDYEINLDDEGGFIQNCPFDPIERISNRPEDMGAFISGQRLKEGAPHQGHLDCRIGLWEFTKSFLKRNNIVPRSPLLQKLLKDKNAEGKFHFLPWADSYVIKTKMFKSDLWRKWISSVNEDGGIYKYRWGDNEIYSLFYLIYSNNPIYNMKLVEKGYYNQGLFRGIQNIAPGTRV